MKFIIKIFLLTLLFPSKVLAAEYFYILNDKCITNLYTLAESYFKDSQILPIRDSRGLILRLYFEDPIKESQNLNLNAYKRIEAFLAKIENPAIIEVHIANFPYNKLINLKKWELSTIMANKIESLITVPYGIVEQNRINSIGYGEFLPAKNPPNNGGKSLNRVDIIILCNIIGE